MSKQALDDDDDEIWCRAPHPDEPEPSVIIVGVTLNALKTSA